MGVAFEVTPDVQRYDEALDWFGKRVVMTAVDARKLDDDAKADAFWVGGGLHLTQVQRVFDKIKVALEQGDSFDDFKKAVAGELRNEGHVETVFRNATQRAYNAGRWQQMKEESTAKFRPYWLYDALLDPRTTDVCKLCNGTLLPHDHPWWRNHVPPLHHRCRSSIRNLRRTEAEKRGISLVPPGEGGDPKRGWGQEPSSPVPWKPDPAKHDAQLLLDFGAKETWGTKKRKPRSKIDKKPKLDLDTWVAHYEPKYGAEAAKSLGHGRAALELGLDLPVRDVREELQKLTTVHKGAGFKRLVEACEDCDADRTLRDQAGELDPLRKAAAALAGHLKTLKPRKPWSHVDLDPIEVDRQAGALLSALCGRKTALPGPQWRFRPVNYGGATSVSGKVVEYDGLSGTLEHELGHCLEMITPGLFDRAVAFLRVRTKGEKPKNHGQNGLCRDDQFVWYYVGRDYSRIDGTLFGTEITSTALEHLVTERGSWGTLAEAVQKDPEHFLFLLGQLAGP